MHIKFIFMIVLIAVSFLSRHVWFDVFNCFQRRKLCLSISGHLLPIQRLMSLCLRILPPDYRQHSPDLLPDRYLWAHCRLFPRLPWELTSYSNNSSCNNSCNNNNGSVSRCEASRDAPLKFFQVLFMKGNFYRSTILKIQIFIFFFWTEYNSYPANVR